MRKELTNQFLKSLAAPDTGRVEISDTLRRGLRLRVYSGSPPRFVWMFEKRVKDGPKRKHTLGQYPQVSLALARSIAQEIATEAEKGIDRIANRKAEKLAEELAQANIKTTRQVLGIYEKLHLSNLRTHQERLRQLTSALKDQLDHPIQNLTKSHLQAAIDRKAGEGRKVAANRIRSTLRTFTRWAAQRDYIEADIGAGLPNATKEEIRERVLSLSEIHAIWEATFQMGSLWGPMLRLLILTGQRRSEIANLRWDEINTDKAQIVKSGSATKNGKPHTTHLSTAALNEIEALPSNNSEFVFTTTGKTPVSGHSKAKRRLDGLLEGVHPWRLHDLRTALATALAEAGEPESVVDRILNHVASGSAPSAVARVYNQSELLKQRAKALDRWADMVTGKRGKVTKLYG
ncbi:tyrosine-type recombinase/integrase [Amylibacter sp. IMCC11727]|uniref:tyrosine-type recombinase/integrase n=1 Tax=Amylibacter sp. IMCC11727 TaxID=3039851 RepID=UPI00244E13AF|nr:tyrosine-type recombinase/integrase [Amylibacter sp. IMCC11727]WGI22405.1 tyrosine-type recombinase/integrase [Amylibacter sp. IMCC11727]